MLSTVNILSEFRKNMGSELFRADAKRIFKADITYLNDGEINEISQKKLMYAKNYVRYLKVFNLVKYIGVSGSVAAGIAKDIDDIDFFVVVKNNTLWIYRGLLVVKNLFNPRFRKSKSIAVKDLICVNLICEERGLKFDNDIFNLHEIYYLKSVYNEDYFENILISNQWLKRWGGVFGSYDRRLKRFNILLEAINLYFFLPQLIYMYIIGNNPDIKRIVRNYIRGRIEFFTYEYKQEKLALLKTV